MACLVSITLTAPLRSSLTSTKKLQVLKNTSSSMRSCKLHFFSLPLCSSFSERHQLEYALGRISSTATVTTAQKVLGPCCSDKCISSANRSCQHSPMTCPRFLTSSPYLVVDYFTNIMISGYWVGPDTDDGWGFVEAVIDRIS